MATRKKSVVPQTPQAAFAFPSLTKPTEPKSIAPENAHGWTDQFGGEDPPHAPAVRADAPITPTSLPVVVDAERKLRIVPPIETPEEDVIVEPINDRDRFAVSLLRFHGGSVAMVIYTRKQLEMLLARIPAALEISK